MALVDSGATATMISRGVYEQMAPLRYPLKPSARATVSGIGGGKVGLLGEVQAEFEIAGGVWPLDVSVSQRHEPVPCYLGMDFFHKHGVDFSVLNGAFTIGGETVQMDKEGRPAAGFCACIRLD